MIRDHSVQPTMTAGMGIAYSPLEQIHRQIKRHLLPPAWGGTPVPFGPQPEVIRWDLAAQVNLARSLKKL